VTAGRPAKPEVIINGAVDFELAGLATLSAWLDFAEGRPRSLEPTLPTTVDHLATMPAEEPQRSAEAPRTNSIWHASASPPPSDGGLPTSSKSRSKKIGFRSIGLIG
jgi:hypothetical protein